MELAEERIVLGVGRKTLLLKVVNLGKYSRESLCRPSRKRQLCPGWMSPRHGWSGDPLLHSPPLHLLLLPGRSATWGGAGGHWCRDSSSGSHSSAIPGLDGTGWPSWSHALLTSSVFICDCMVPSLNSKPVSPLKVVWLLGGYGCVQERANIMWGCYP